MADTVIAYVVIFVVLICWYMAYRKAQGSKYKNLLNAIMCGVAGCAILYSVLDSFIDSLKVSLALFLLGEPFDLIKKMFKQYVTMKNVKKGSI